jgi:hypothetical protein
VHRRHNHGTLFGGREQLDLQREFHKTNCIRSNYIRTSTGGAV